MRPDIIILLVITAFLWGATPVLEKIGLGRTDALTGVTIRSVAVTLALLLYAAVSGKLKAIFSADAKTLMIFSATGIMAGLIGMLTYFAALKEGATSRIVPIAAAYPLVTALLSILILKENVTPFRILGTVLIITGIWFVKA